MGIGVPRLCASAHPISGIDLFYFGYGSVLFRVLILSYFGYLVGMRCFAYQGADLPHSGYHCAAFQASTRPNSGADISSFLGIGAP